MVRVNEYYQLLPGGYLFSEIAHRVDVFQKQHPDQKILRLGIGDVTRPLVPAVVEALKKASAEMGNAETFRGYGPEQGYAFLREKIAEIDYRARGVAIDVDEIFISDGAKSDCGNIGDIFGPDNVVAVCDPVYPVYVDTNIMAGRAGDHLEGQHWNRIVYLNATAENEFCPAPPQEKADLIYLCFPNNPTGAMITRERLKEWVDYALTNRALLLYDAAYEAFISEPELPHSIFEIEGAERCAIEFRSFSKTAGFTGTRCAFTVIPKTVMGYDRDGQPVPLNPLWNRRQCTKFNGVPYIIQRAAEAVYSEQGQQQVKENITYYLNNAKIIREGLCAAGFTATGGINSPYVWMQTPAGTSSWDCFDQLLHRCCVVTTPGEGFGPCGEGYIRLSALGDVETTQQAVDRIVNTFASKR